MRYAPSITSTTVTPTTRQVRGVSAAKAVKPVYPPEQVAPFVEQVAEHRAAMDAVAQQQRRAEPQEDRRKVCRRVAHQPVLEELRSGIERRRNSARNGDAVDHIDVEA